MDIKELVIKNLNGANIKTCLIHFVCKVSMRSSLLKLIGNSEMLQLGCTDKNCLLENS